MQNISGKLSARVPRHNARRGIAIITRRCSYNSWQGYAVGTIAGRALRHNNISEYLLAAKPKRENTSKLVLAGRCSRMNHCRQGIASEISRKIMCWQHNARVPRNKSRQGILRVPRDKSWQGNAAG
ncbi:unnamed protein product [Amoebophrya sp. A120]|nr:unnamed protein product [Amoebophrya sp. A120]|eukprot:GSA120T00012942001.1